MSNIFFCQPGFGVPCMCLLLKYTAWCSGSIFDIVFCTLPMRDCRYFSFINACNDTRLLTAKQSTR